MSPDLPDAEIFEPSVYRCGLATVLFVVLAGSLLGLAATREVIRHRWDIGAQRVGAWTMWPNVGTARIDPYARAILARSAQIPLAAGEGLTFTADRDESGRRLTRDCSYRLTGFVPQSRAWTITAATPDGFVIANPAQRYAFTDSEVLRHMDGSVTIELSADARPGNWLPVTGHGPFVLVLRLYDTTLTLGLGSKAPMALPALQMKDCLPP